MLVNVSSHANPVPLALGDVKLIPILEHPEKPTESVNSLNSEDDDASTDDEETQKEPINQGKIIGFTLKINGNVVAKHNSVETYVLGRGAKNTNLALQPFVDTDIHKKWISKRHAEISYSEKTGTFNLKGLSTKKTLFPIKARDLKDRDIIEICGVIISFDVIRAVNGSTQARDTIESRQSTTTATPNCRGSSFVHSGATQTATMLLTTDSTAASGLPKIGSAPAKDMFARAAEVRLSTGTDGNLASTSTSEKTNGS